jgi:hypothetical protein
MRYYLFSILFYSFLFFSCKKKEVINDRIDFLVEKTEDSLKIKPKTVIKIRDTVVENEVDFLDRLKQIKKEKLPVKFHSYLIDSLHNEVKFSNDLHKLLSFSFDSISNVNPTYKAKISLSNIHERFDDYKSHYSLLFHKGKDDICCDFSKEIVFKKLVDVENNIRSFLTITRFKGQKGKHFLGLIINLVTYDLKKDKEIDKKAISMVGYGYENTEYYEGFVIYKDSILAKGYNYTEPEMNIINKRFYISDKGMIKSSYDIELISFEEEP